VQLISPGDRDVTSGVNSIPRYLFYTLPWTIWPTLAKNTSVAHFTRAMSTHDLNASPDLKQTRSRFLTPPTDQTEPDDSWTEPPPPSQYGLAKRKSRSYSPRQYRPVKKEKVVVYDSDIEIVDDGSDSDVEILVFVYLQVNIHILSPRWQSHQPARWRDPTSAIKAEAHPPTHSAPAPQPIVKHEVFFVGRTEPSSTHQYEHDDAPPPASQAPISGFFSQRPDFPYDPSQSTMSQYQKLKKKETDMPSHAFRRMQQGFHDSIAEAFNLVYGTDVNSLEAWHKLCTLLGCWNIPDNVEACKRVSCGSLNVLCPVSAHQWGQMVIRYTHVNIYDLIEADRLDILVRVFDTVEELAVYTRTNKLFFPRDNAVAGGFLKFLLRRVVN
jgi:hypothetical protein